MKAIIILLFPLTLFSQKHYYLRESVKGTIFYEITSYNIPITTSMLGKIEIFTDSLQAFGLTWRIEATGKTKILHDNVTEANYCLDHKGQKAFLTVKNKDAILSLKGLFDITMEQYPHIRAYYSEFP